MQRLIYRLFYFLALAVLFTISATACTGGKHPSAVAVERFFQALVDKNEAQYVTFTCADYELDALLEFDAFSLVKSRLEDLDCQATDVDGDAATVVCQGAIIATYGAEDQIFELSERSYNMVNQDGAWLVCGY